MNRILLITFILISLYLKAQQQPSLVLPLGNLGGITKLDKSPNGELLLTEDLNSDIIIYDSDRFIELQRHNYEEKKLTSSTFLNDSSVVSICNDTAISIWNFYSGELDIYPISNHLKKIYVKEYGLYLIDKDDNVFKFYIDSHSVHLEKFITKKAQELYFKSQNELLLVNSKKLMLMNLASNSIIEKKFNSEISALTWNSIGNILIGFENGTITEFDSSLNLSHNYLSSTDRISTISYFGDSMIITGSYNYSVLSQNKKGLVSSFFLDDWAVGMVVDKSEVIICSWNGLLVELDHSLLLKKEFQTGLKKSTFFCQEGNFLFISYNDGSVSKFDLRDNKRTKQYKISDLPIIGIDINHDASELIIWNDNGLIVFNTNENKISVEMNRSDIESAKFIPNSSNYIFCSGKYLYCLSQKKVIDSIPILNSWSIIETRDNSLIVSGFNRIIEIKPDFINVQDVKNVGQIWTTQKNIDNSYLLGTDRELYHLDKEGETHKIADFPMIIDNIELIDKEKILVNCENGQLIQIDLKSKRTKIIADTKLEYGCWDIKVNVKSGKIIYPNSKTWDYKMDVDVLDLNGEPLKKLENIGGEVICVSNSNKSIEFNQLDSNQVIFIVSDGSVKLWDINSDGKDPVTQLGINYYNLLKSELKDFNIKGAFLKSGLLKLPIPAIDTLTFISLKNDDWLVHDSKYRFDGTPGAIEKLYFTCGLEVVGLNQVKDSLYVPNLVQRYLNGEKLEHIPEINNLRICGYTPLVEPIDSLKYKIIPRNGGIGDVDVFINGIQRLTYNTEKLKFENGFYLLKIDQCQINLYETPGIPIQIKVQAKTADNSVSSRGAVIDVYSDEQQTQLKPSIHAVMIGVDNYKDKSLELRFATKDANDLHKTLQLAAKNYFNIDDTNRVFFYNLTVSADGKTGNDNIKGITPDRGNIIKTLQRIKESSKPEDIFLLFFAGHGEIVDNGQLLLLTTESTRDNFQGIKMNELLTIMNEIPAGKRVLILDACHSGAAINNLDMANFSGKRDVEDSERESQRLKELDKLANKSGFAIITASSSDQTALELPQYEHGLLTYSLLSALIRNKSVLDEDNHLVLEKWFIAAEEEMEKMNKDQNAEKMVPVSFNLGILNEEVEKTIQIKEIPIIEIDEVINEHQFLNDLFPLDNLGIKEKILNIFHSLNQSGNVKIFLSESSNRTNLKMIVKYDVSDDLVKLKFNIIDQGVLQFKVQRVANFDKLDKVINEIAIEIINNL